MSSAESSVKISARTVEKALAQAATELGVSPDALDYRLISQTKGGLFSFIGRKVEIEAWPLSAEQEDDHLGAEEAELQNLVPLKKPRRSRGGSSRSRHGARSKPSGGHAAAGKNERRSRRGGSGTSPREESRREYPRVVKDETPLSEDQVKEIKEQIRKACDDICQYLIGSETYELATREENGRFTIDIYDESLGKQVAKNVKIAESLEHILRKVPKIQRELPFRIFVDVNEIRQSRESELVVMARDLSEKVHDNKRPIVLNYKNSYDRKIIHMALDQDDRVYTKSIGEGSNRKLMILPARGEESSSDPMAQ